MQFAEDANTVPRMSVRDEVEKRILDQFPVFRRQYGRETAMTGVGNRKTKILADCS